MASKSMSFSRSSSGYNTQGQGDTIDYTPDSTLTFGSNCKCTYFTFYINGGLTSATTRARNHDLSLVLEDGNGGEHKVWDSTLNLPAKGTTGKSIEISGSISGSSQSSLGSYGIKDLWFEQEGDYSLRGTNSKGTLTIEYEVI
jgi:hypothetical protein